jgi:hypothetical protein
VKLALVPDELFLECLTVQPHRTWPKHKNSKEHEQKPKFGKHVEPNEPNALTHKVG